MPDLFKQDHPVVERPYRCRCGGNLFYVGAKKPPHGYQLRCVNCGFGGFWLPKGEAPDARPR